MKCTKLDQPLEKVVLQSSYDCVYDYVQFSLSLEPCPFRLTYKKEEFPWKQF